MCMLCLDAQRALELLQQYRAKLDQRQQSQSRTKQGLVEEDHQLQQSLDRVISVFQSQLFSALLGREMFACFLCPVTFLLHVLLYIGSQPPFPGDLRECEHRGWPFQNLIWAVACLPGIKCILIKVLAKQHSLPDNKMFKSAQLCYIKGLLHPNYKKDYFLSGIA